MIVIALSNCSGALFSVITGNRNSGNAGKEWKTPPRDGCMEQGGFLALAENPVNRKQLALKRLLWAWLEDTDGAQ